MSTYTENESYKHKMAKEVLKEWFYGGERIGKVGGCCPNRECGVCLEYPIVKQEGYIDGSNNKIGGTNSIDNNWDEILQLEDDCVPTYDECIRMSMYPKRIIDVVLTHKGHPEWFIEICHKNPTSQEKINELKKLGVYNLIEIDAEWIMKQTKKPTRLEYKQLI